MVAKRSARSERTRAINQARALILTGPDEPRGWFAGHRAAALAAGIAALRPRLGDAADYRSPHSTAGARPPRRVPRRPDRAARRPDRPARHRRAGLLALYGVGPDTAALLLVAAGGRPERLHGEAAWAHMCAVAPIPASSGKARRYRRAWRKPDV